MTDTSPNFGVRTDYTEPVRRLLSIGESWENDSAKWPDYAAKFGLGSEHIPELIRMACDAGLYGSDPDRTEVWAPVHARRALGGLGAEASVRPLLAFLKSAGEDDDWTHTELPVAFGLIGATAIQPVAAFIRDQSNSTFPAATAVAGLKEIARRHPVCRAECIGILGRLLERRGDTDPALNGFAVSALIDLGAVEAIDVIRDAFRHKSVDISIAGDEEDVEIALRLRERRATPRPRYQMMPASWSGRPDSRRETDDSPRPRKVGRNDPCPCGSGKKYKKCCLA
jgi:SEC-C motif